MSEIKKKVCEGYKKIGNGVLRAKSPPIRTRMPRLEL